MNKFMGISGKKMTSICFLLVVLFITLILGSLTFLINDNAATMPNIGFETGLEGNINHIEGLSDEENEKMKLNMDKMKENTKNIPEHSKNPTKK